MGRDGKEWDVGVLYGEFRHTVDDKGRLSLPAKFRSKLGERVVVSKGVDKCLYVYPLKEFEAVVERLEGHASLQKEFRDFHRFFLAGSYDTEVDGHGRILIQAGHREYAGLQRDVVVIGISHRAEIWDAETYEASEETARSNFAAVAEKVNFRL